MAPASETLSISILAIMYFGDVVFAVSGALTAARYRMDILGFVLIGTITGIGGGQRAADGPHGLVDPGSARIDTVRGGGLGHLLFYSK